MPADYRELRLSNIDQLDQGVIAAIFDENISKALQDCDDRPNDKSKRTIILRLDMIPVPDSTGCRCLDIGLQAQVHSNVPKQKSRVYMMPIKSGRDARGRERISAHFLPHAEQEDMFTDAPDAEKPK